MLPRLNTRENGIVGPCARSAAESWVVSLRSPYQMVMSRTLLPLLLDCSSLRIKIWSSRATALYVQCRVSSRALGSRLGGVPAEASIEYIQLPAVLL